MYDFGVGVLRLGLVGVRAVHLGEGRALGAVFLEHPADVLAAAPGPEQRVLNAIVGPPG